MEAIWLFLGVFIHKLFGGGKQDSGDAFIKVDDKNYIIDEKPVSLEEDTEIDKMRQSFEDRRRFREYSIARRQAEVGRYIEEWYKTAEYYRKYKDDIDALAEEGAYKDKYDEYIGSLNKLQEDNKLSYEQFIAMQEHPLGCISFKQMPIMGGLYTIHSPSTSKYDDKDALLKEFEERYY